jgi:carbamoyltransferase
MYSLGISAYYHDSAATLLKNGVIIAAAQEERFTRVKQDPGFPIHAIKYCLQEGNIQLSDIQHICYSEKPFLKFERLLDTYLAEAPFGLRSFLHSMPIWIKEKLFLKNRIIQELSKIQQESLHPLQKEAHKTYFFTKSPQEKEINKIKKALEKKLLFTEHHQAHAASAFYASPFTKAAIVTIDGVGEWATTSIAYGEGHKMTVLEEMHFPHSLGLLYSAFTYFLGFKVNSGEYKVMGLAPYGKDRYSKHIKKHLIDIKPDGSFRMNMKYFHYCRGLHMTNKAFSQLFSIPKRTSETDLSQTHMDIAASLQVVTEEIIIKIIKHAKKITGASSLCLAGGVALNCVANGKILQENIFKDIWIQPAAGDAGGSLGAAYCAYFSYKKDKDPIPSPHKEGSDKMKGSFLGPQFSNKNIKKYLDSIDASYVYAASEATLVHQVAKYIADAKVIGWHQGRMEFGPRSLGNRSILGDARNKNMQSIMNQKIKYRESFRPFAPSVLEEDIQQYFDIQTKSPYMLLTAPVKQNTVNKNTPLQEKKNQPQESLNNIFIQQLKSITSVIPAVTHVDYSARVQSVSKKTNPRYYKLIQAFKKQTGSSVLINTSFNVRGEPIVCTPKDSYTCFMRTEMDVLVLGNYILLKTDQKPLLHDSNWQKEFELD